MSPANRLSYVSNGKVDHVLGGTVYRNKFDRRWYSFASPKLLPVMQSVNWRTQRAKMKESFVRNLSIERRLGFVRVM